MLTRGNREVEGPKRKRQTSRPAISAWVPVAMTLGRASGGREQNRGNSINIEITESNGNNTA